MTQTADEMFFTLVRGFNKAGDQQTTVEQLRKAEDRIGRRPADKLKWALNFADSDLAQLTAGDWMNLALEIAAFKLPIFTALNIPSSETISLGPTFGVFPSKQQIEQIHDRFKTLLHSFERDGSIDFTSKGGFSVALRRQEDGSYSIGYSVSDYVANCMIALVKLLGEYGDRVRVCPSDQDGCGKHFLASRADRVYCSTTCLGRATTHRYRAKPQRKDKRHGKR